MEVVVSLALLVLSVICIISLILLILLFLRRQSYKKELRVHSMRFSKLQKENADDVVELGPYISKKLDDNKWIEKAPGIFQNCVSVLKLCHSLTDKMNKIKINKKDAQAKYVISLATRRIVPRFDLLIESLNSSDINFQVIESRMSSLVSACWAVVLPYYLTSLIDQEQLVTLVREMEKFHNYFCAELEKFEFKYPIIELPPSPNPSTSGAYFSKLSISDNDSIKNDDEVISSDHSSDRTLVISNNSSKNNSPNKSDDSNKSNSALIFNKSDSTTPLISQKLNESESIELTELTSLKSKSTDLKKPLLSDETPTDPTCY